MSKKRVVVLGSTGKSILIDDSLGPRLAAVEAALAALKLSNTTQQHSSLQGLQVGDDHPQYPLKLGRETIKGQWDFTKQIWASLGNAAAPGYAFTLAPDTGLFGSFVAGDPYFSSVVALLHANAAAPFVDSSSYARAITTTGTVTADAVTKKFGAASAKILADGSSRLSFANAAELSLATGDWTIDFWVYPVSSTSFQIYKNAFTTLYPCQINVSAGLAINAVGADAAGATVYNLTGLANVPLNQWVHIEVSRSGSTFRLFQDGVLQQQATFAGTLGENTAAWRIGPVSGADTRVDDFRMTVGVARHTSAFIPPTAEAPDVGDVVSESITVDGTERYRFAQLGQLGIGGATYGTARQSFLSGGASAPPTWSTLAHTDVSDWDEAVQDTVGAFLVDSTSIDFTYSDVGNTLTAATINANPSGLIGMSAVNGAAATPLRSDGLHAIDPAIVPTWTGLHTFEPASGVPFNGLRAGVNGAGLAAALIVRTDGKTVNDGNVFAFQGRNTSNATVNYGFVGSTYLDTVAGTEDGTLEFYTILNGVGPSLRVRIQPNGDTRLLADSQELQLGASQDLRLFHDGTDSWIRNDTGTLKLSSGATSVFEIAAARGAMKVPIQTKGYIVATLPAGVQGDRAHVTDANAPVFGAAVAAGGAITVPVYYTGAAWFVG